MSASVGGPVMERLESAKGRVAGPLLPLGAVVVAGE